MSCRPGALLLTAPKTCSALAKAPLPERPTRSLCLVLTAPRLLPAPPFRCALRGFSKKNELLNGRLAMLGFTAALLMEGPSGGLGPLGQLAWWAGQPATDGFYSSCGFALALWAVLATTIAAAEGSLTSVAGDEDVY